MVPEGTPAFPFRLRPSESELNPIRFGRLTDEPIDAYHAAPVLSKTKLDDFRRSPRYFQGLYITGEYEKERTEALLMGGALDALAIEGEAAFFSRYAIVASDAPRRPTRKQLTMFGPEAKRKPTPAAVRSKTFWDTFDAANEGKEALTQEQADDVKLWAEKLNANETFAALRASCLTQVTYRLRGDKFAVQVRPDLIDEKGTDSPKELTRGLPFILDVKTVRELPQDDPEFLPRHVAEFGYHRGAFMYPEIVAKVNRWGDFRPQFILALIEKAEPNAVMVKPVDAISTEIGEVEVLEAMMRLDRCLTDNIWPETWETPMTPVGLPGWYVRRTLENSPVRSVMF